jgi:hypothetical protein
MKYVMIRGHEEAFREKKLASSESKQQLTMMIIGKDV